MDTHNAATNRNIRAVSQILMINFFVVVFFFAAIFKTNAATASLYRTDTSTQGNWQGIYGGDGAVIANATQNIPAYASFAVQNQATWTWAATSSDARALQNGTGRIASTYYNGSSFSFTVNINDGGTHAFAMYALDWDNKSRSETIQIIDTNSNNVLASQTISNFTNGIYLAYNIAGSVKINVTANSGPNAVISGVFFGNGTASGAAAPKSATASLQSTDVTTQGSWMGVYGADGFSIANGTQSVPSYATSAVQNQSSWTWASSTTDPRALAVSNGRLAATWYGASKFNFNVNFTDGAAHTFALYAVDFDNQGRSETIQIADANSNAVLSSQNISSFTNGMYLVYSISGNVKITVTCNGGPNAVISGVFFGGATVKTTQQPVSAPVTTAPVTPAATYVLNASVSSLSFGSVAVGQNGVQTLTLTNSGTGNINIVNVTIGGAGFNAAGVSAGTVILPGQAEVINVTFAPAAAGSATGSIVIASNATASTITLSGTGAAQHHSVALGWTASSSANITGYNTYFSTVSGGPYAKLNASPAAGTGYTDTTVTSGMTRYYVVTAVNASGQESGYSTEVGVTIQ